MAYEEVLDKIKHGHNVLLHGPGGTGKTFLIKRLVADLRRENWVCGMTAMTGVAAINCGGNTLHAWAGIFLGNGEPEKLARTMFPKPRHRWQTTNLLIIDEISMMGKLLFDKLNRIGQIIRGDARPFGGLQILVSGDFLQLPPVNDDWVFTSDKWDDMKWNPVILSTPMRYLDDEYFSLLMRIRSGKHTPKDVEFLESRVVPPVAINNIFPIRIFPLLAQVDALNKKELAKLQGECIMFEAFDEFHRGKSVPVTILDDMAPRLFSVRVGAQVMLRVNMLDVNLANGSLGIVTAIDDLYVKVKFMNDVEIMIQPVKLTAEDSSGHPLASRTQIPLILAWAISAHKSQGCTLDAAICSIGESIFLGGQAYVALSRVRTGNGLFLREFDSESLRVDKIALRYVQSLETEHVDK